MVVVVLVGKLYICPKKEIVMARFVNPFTDFGFKKLFGAGVDRHFPFENITFNRKQQNQYEKSLKYYRDLKNVTDTAFFEGKEEGLAEGFEMGKDEGIEIGIELGETKATKRTAKNMKEEGIPIPTIAKITGLSIEEIEQL